MARLQDTRSTYQNQLYIRAHTSNCTHASNEYMKTKIKNTVLLTWIERLTILKMSILSKQIYGFSAISVTIPARFLVDTHKLILEFI